MFRAIRKSLNTNCYLIIVTACLVFSGCAKTAPELSDEQNAQLFDEMKALAGTWETRSNGNSPKETVTYRVTSGGTVVEETLFTGEDHEMVSMYFPSGNTFVMRHYCALGNQPELAATVTNPKNIHFSFVGGSGIDANHDGHIHEMNLELVSANHIRHEWIFYKDGKKDQIKQIDLYRVQ